jgi:GWxTD domain-containing protein
MERTGTDSLGRPTIVPSVMGNFTEKDSALFVSFEVYRRMPVDSVNVSYTVATLKKDILKSTPGILHLIGFRTPAVLEVPRKNLRGGRYLLKLFVKSDKEILERSIPFTVRWIGMPVSTSDITKAAEQMKYIARGGEIKKIKKAKGNEQEQLFKEFWASKDPTPGTERNELMEEYYRRVAFATESFGTYNEGWKTDMGMVYIILGPPNDVERYPFEENSKPYEVWYYYTINRRFTFVDYTGFGEYRLINPDWEALRNYQ